MPSMVNYGLSTAAIRAGIGQRTAIRLRDSGHITSTGLTRLGRPGYTEQAVTDAYVAWMAGRLPGCHDPDNDPDPGTDDLAVPFVRASTLAEADRIERPEPPKSSACRPQRRGLVVRGSNTHTDRCRAVPGNSGPR